MARKTLSGGDKLQAKLREMARKVGQKATLNVGFLEDGATEPNGTPSAQVAFWQEFGAPRAGIPPRPFFRTMIAAKSPEWGAALAELLKREDYDSVMALSALGEDIVGQLQESIRDVNGPPLSPVTLLLRQRFGNHPELIRGRDVRKARRDIARGVVPKVSGTGAKPLQWTGTMIKAVGKEVEKG